MLPSVFLYLFLDLKGNGVVGKGKASTTSSSVSYTLCPTHVFTFISFLSEASSVLHFLRLMPIGERIIDPKQKDCTTTLFSENFLQKFEFAKTLLTAKGRTFLGGDFI